MEVTADGLSCLVPVVLHATLPLEAEGLWEELVSSSVDPLRLLVIAEALNVKPPPLTLHHLDAFISHPSYGYEYFLFQVGFALKHLSERLTFLSKRVLNSKAVMCFEIGNKITMYFKCVGVIFFSSF